MKFKYIDALRGIAILLVMIVHTSQYGEKSQNEFFNSFFKQKVQLHNTIKKIFVFKKIRYIFIFNFQTTT